MTETEKYAYKAQCIASLYRLTGVIFTLSEVPKNGKI